MFKIQVAGCWLQDAGCWIPDQPDCGKGFRCRMPDDPIMIPDADLPAVPPIAIGAIGISVGRMTGCIPEDRYHFQNIYQQFATRSSISSLLPIANCPPPSLKLRRTSIADCLFAYLFPIAYCLLPVANCLVLIALLRVVRCLSSVVFLHCQLPISQYPNPHYHLLTDFFLISLTKNQ